MYSSFELVKLIVKPPPDVLGDQIMKENFTLFAAIVSDLMWKARQRARCNGDSVLTVEIVFKTFKSFDSFLSTLQEWNREINQKEQGKWQRPLVDYLSSAVMLPSINKNTSIGAALRNWEGQVVKALSAITSLCKRDWGGWNKGRLVSYAKAKDFGVQSWLCKEILRSELTL